MLEALYVDDDPDIREIVRLSLSLDPGISVRLAASGREALDMLGAGTWRPDVVLLDVMMPQTNGPDLLCALRGLDLGPTPPVIFVTARSRQSEIAGYLRIGAIGVINKPFDPLSLAKQVRGLMALS